MDRAENMGNAPEYTIQCFGNADALPAEAEEMFRDELAYSREPLPEDRADRGKWQFACICAVTGSGHVLGGVHLDMGPMNFGPLANENLAFLEEVFVRPEYRNNGIATALMQEASAIAKGAGCSHIRGSVDWGNPAAIALYRRCGFALTDISDSGQSGEYFIVKPL
jgi:GNAT superfamily N-acetyltransferase